MIKPEISEPSMLEIGKAAMNSEIITPRRWLGNQVVR